VELAESFDRLTEAGLGVVAISYDSVAILNSFSERHGGVRYTMLSDPESEIINAFGIRNTDHAEGSMGYGIPYPGTYIVDVDGVVVEKFFAPDYRERFTADTILLKTFGVGGGQRVEAELPQFKLAAYPVEDAVYRGNRIVLVADIELPPRMHLYAAGSDYRPVDLRIADNAALTQGELAIDPEPQILYLDVIDERVPVYHGKVRVQREIALSPEFPEPSVEIAAVLSYQTCDDEICYVPAEFPLTFELEVLPLDGKRAPQDIRH
jgi:hypothetical protein